MIFLITKSIDLNAYAVFIIFFFWDEIKNL